MRGSVATREPAIAAPDRATAASAHRQAHDERGALLLARRHADRTLVGADDLVDDVEPEPEALAAADPDERIEQRRDGFGRNRLAVVVDRQQRVIAGGLDANRDRTFAV